jgi:precorrin-6B methylase 1
MGEERHRGGGGGGDGGEGRGLSTVSASQAIRKASLLYGSGDILVYFQEIIISI